MARNRTVKPEFFEDEDLAELSFGIRILFEGLWCYADKEGRLEDRPIKLKAQIFPYDKIDIDKGLNALSLPKRHSPKHEPFIVRYEVDGDKYIQILNFHKHQSPHHTERESRIPPLNGLLTVIKPLGSGGRGDAQESESESESSLSSLIKEIILYLNAKTGNNFSPKSKPTIEHISARIAEGRTLEDCKRVIDIKVADWKGRTWPDTRPGREGKLVIGDNLLRPSTLFRATNFENYLNESATPAKVKKKITIIERDGTMSEKEIEE